MTAPHHNRAMFAPMAAMFGDEMPIYRDICLGIAESDEIAGLLDVAPTGQRLPVLLLASVHALVLEHRSAPLARWFASVVGPGNTPTSGNPFDEFADFCREYGAPLAVLLRTRSTQTNEVGRCRFYLPAIALVAAEVGPLSLVDIGTSAGLNLHLDRFSYEYVAVGNVGVPGALHLSTKTRAPLPLPRAMPTIAGRLGVDLHPIDVGTSAEARWLQACIWPEQYDRFARLSAAIEIALAHPVEIRTGDAIEALPSAIESAVRHGHPTIMNSWVLSYLSPAQRTAYVETLDMIGSTTDVSWIYAESPGFCDHLPFPPGAYDADSPTYLMLVTWRAGRRRVRHLATTHPHGNWIDWVDVEIDDR